MPGNNVAKQQLQPLFNDKTRMLAFIVSVNTLREKCGVAHHLIFVLKSEECSTR